MTRRLPPDIELRLCAILREARPAALGEMNDEQACRDFAWVLIGLPAAIERDRQRPGRGRRRKPERLLADLAAAPWQEHTGQPPSCVGQHPDPEYRDRPYGRFAAVLALLLAATGVTLTEQERRNLSISTARESKRGIGGSLDARKAALATHVVGYEDAEGNFTDDPGLEFDADGKPLLDDLGDGLFGLHANDPIFAGYEPAPDPDMDWRAAFAHLLSKPTD